MSNINILFVSRRMWENYVHEPCQQFVRNLSFSLLPLNMKLPTRIIMLTVTSLIWL